jgi:hypothetical protein
VKEEVNNLLKWDLKRSFFYTKTFKIISSHNRNSYLSNEMIALDFFAVQEHLGILFYKMQKIVNQIYHCSTTTLRRKYKEKEIA